MLEWLLGAVIGPAACALPVNWAADALASAARRWFRRLRRTDDLSRLVRAGTGSAVDLTNEEFTAVRQLLEDPHTWSLLGRGTVEDLAAQIAACMPQRTADDAHAAALVIARGLLEFAVADLDQNMFQKVLLARLNRMDTGLASALDEALLGLHGDLIAGFANVLDRLKQVLERLPPGPAQRGEVAVYLRVLIDWLSKDPWPRDRRFGGPLLAPADIERKLRITTTSRAADQRNLDADDLAQQCRRLVILGAPGSGKTWLAKRTARRCAEKALEALNEDAALDEFDLPLYTTCSRLLTETGDIREAAVSSAVDHLGDLGGSRIRAALKQSFTERGAQTLLVIDSLDEARGADERLHEADTLPWRIVLTSRPNSWNQQLTIETADEASRVGELQPLQYPADVEPFIRRWFAQRPEWGSDLIAQLARRPSLQQAATVPLILAFYCIVGGHKPLPEFRHDLYAKVLRRMLTGLWRGSQKGEPDVRFCLAKLRSWAWSGASSDPFSGVGIWRDEVLTEPTSLSKENGDALDSIAAPLGPPDMDTGQTQRRFIHRSVREHLVAEKVARLPVPQAVEALLPHLWYDHDWEYVAPAAIAMHPQRDQLLRDLILRAAGSALIPADLSVVDGGWEFQGLLSRLAAESNPADWSAEMVAAIEEARARLAQSGRARDLGQAVSWEASNRRIRRALLELLSAQDARFTEGRLVDGVVDLAITAGDKRQAREVLLGLLGDQAGGWSAASLASGVARLEPTAADRRQAREVLLGLLGGRVDDLAAASLVGGVVELATTAEDRRQAREVLLGLLGDQAGGRLATSLVSGVARLEPTAEDRRQAREVLLGLLGNYVDSSVAGSLVSEVAEHATTTEDKRQVRQALLGLLAEQANGSVAAKLAGGIVRLESTVVDRQQVRQALLDLLAGLTDRSVTERLVQGVTQPDRTIESTSHDYQTLFEFLAGHDAITESAKMPGVVVQPGWTVSDKRRAREALFVLLEGQVSSLAAADLVSAMMELAPTLAEKCQVGHMVLTLMARAPYRQVGLARLISKLPTVHKYGLSDRRFHGRTTADLVDGVVHLATTAEDTLQSREALLELLAREALLWQRSHWPGLGIWSNPTFKPLVSQLDRLQGTVAAELVDGVARLTRSAEDQRDTLEVLLGLLRGQTNAWITAELINGLARLATTSENRRRVREALLECLISRAGFRMADELVDGLVLLATTLEDQRQVRAALLRLLGSREGRQMTRELATGIARLAMTADDKRQARQVLLGLLHDQADGWTARSLVTQMASLSPTTSDLDALSALAVEPTADLLDAVRRNSAPAAWLAALPRLAGSTGQ